MSKGVQGDGYAVPLYNIKSAVARWLHGSEDSMSWITQRSELCNSVSQFLQNCSTPFSSSQSGKANCESAASGGKNKKCFVKSINELQCFNQSKINPRWWMKYKVERAVACYIKTLAKKGNLF